MTYNKQKGLYEADILLKQGFYDYQYAELQADGTVSLTEYEGSHFETENNYIIFVYYTSLDLQADRLVGYNILNSGLR